MDMVKEMDAGNFYQQYKIDIDKEDTYDSLYLKLSKLIEEKTASAIKEIAEGFKSTKQDEELVSK
jgi:methionyl-tRNA formyltransferase